MYFKKNYSWLVALTKHCALKLTAVIIDKGIDTNIERRLGIWAMITLCKP